MPHVTASASRRNARQHSGHVVLLLVLSLGLGCASTPAERTSEPGTHKNEVELAALMGEMQRHSAKLGHAIAGRNRPLAHFYAEEVGEILDQLLSVEDHDGLPIADPAQTILTPLHQSLVVELDSRDLAGAELSYQALIDGCNRCHAATGHEFIVITPASGEPPFNQRFATGEG